MRAIRIGLGVLGVAAMGYALLGAAGDPDIMPGRHTAFLLTTLALHDGVLLPAVILTGVLIHRLVPAGQRAIVQAALAATAAVVIVALPLVLGYGRIADNPSALPRDYPRGLALVIAVIWAAAAVGLLISGRAARRRSPPYAGTD
jgi:hypothetical protein